MQSAADPQSVACLELIRVADAFAQSRCLSRSRVSTVVFGSGMVLERIASGSADVKTGTFERAMKYFSDNWPDGTDWPEGIARPVAKSPAEGAAA